MAAPAEAPQALQPQHQGVISVSSLPTYGGFASSVTAEEWLRQINARIVAQRLAGPDAVAFARQQLTQQAALLFGEDGSAFNRTNRAAADEDWHLWQALFRARYFASNTQAETLAEWTTIRQLPNERAVDTLQRASHSFRVFFDAVNGSEPIPDRVGQPRLFTLSATSLEQMENAAPVVEEAFADVARRIIDLHPGWLQAQAYAARQEQNYNARAAGGAQIPALIGAYQPELDEAAVQGVVTLAVADAVAVIDDHYKNVIIQQVYVDLFENTSRALVLQSLKTALTKPKCREEVFKYLRDPTLSIDDLCTALKQLDFNDQGLAGATRPAGRLNIGATSTTEHEPASDTAGVAPPSAPKPSDDAARIAQLEQAIAALKKKQPKNGQSAGTGSGGTSQPNPNKKDWLCTYCNKTGHLEKMCFTKKRHRKEAGAVSSEPAEN